MDTLAQGVREALGLLLTADASAWAIASRTMLVSGTATALAVVIGVPLGYAITRNAFPGRTLLLGFINTAMGMPPVIVGLVVWLLLVRSGPFGDLGLIYTRTAMILAQFLIATPIVIGFTAASFQALPPRLPDLLAMLGADSCERSGCSHARRSSGCSSRSWPASAESFPRSAHR